MTYIKSTDGIKLAVFDYNPHCKKTVLLVHGWPFSHKIFEYQIGLLTKKGYRVIAPDLRGFGNSDSPTTGYCYCQMAKDLYCIVRAFNLRRFTLVGFSMGGAIALRYMRFCRGYGVEKLILLSAASPSWTRRPGYPYSLPKNYVDQLIQLAVTDRPQLCENFSKQLFANPQSAASIDWFRQIALSASGIGTLRALCALRDEDGEQDLKAVRVPTRIIHGELDEIVSTELAEIQCQSIPNAQLQTLNQSGHGIMYDQLSVFNDYFLNAMEC